MKKKMVWKTVAAACCCGLASCTSPVGETPSTIHLKGQLSDMGTQKVCLRYDGASSVLGSSRDFWLLTDGDGRFDTTLVLKEPAYFNLSRNTLYLSPGDDLTLRVTQNNEEAEFCGTGAAANHYMKHRLFPKAGSFLKGGRNLRGSFEATKALIDSLAAVRMHTLDTLTQVSETFKRMERARVQADVLNSCILYMSYSDLLTGAKTKEERKQRYNDFLDSLTPFVSPLYRNLLDESLLDVAVVRNVLSYSQESDFSDRWFTGIQLPARTVELFDCRAIADRLRNEVTEQTVLEARSMKDRTTQIDFAVELEGLVTKAATLLPGEPAVDFVFTDADGREKRLSDFKGKAIYIDLWATWCGPCIKESPAFDALGVKYAGKDIVFLPVSTDSSTKPWERFLKSHPKQLAQYHSIDTALKEGWSMMYIPRFILIDKDFKIVNAFAPRPSSDEIVKLLDGILAQ